MKVVTKYVWSYKIFYDERDIIFIFSSYFENVYTTFGPCGCFVRCGMVGPCSSMMDVDIGGGLLFATRPFLDV